MSIARHGEFSLSHPTLVRRARPAYARLHVTKLKEVRRLKVALIVIVCAMIVGVPDRDDYVVTIAFKPPVGIKKLMLSMASLELV